MLRELQANLPDAGELEALHAYLDAGGDPAQLGRAEQLFVALRPVGPRLPQRLAVLAFKGALPEAAREALGPLARVGAAMDDLRGSGQLRLVLHTALRLGNTLNAGRRAPQRGIRLGSLRWASRCRRGAVGVSARHPTPPPPTRPSRPPASPLRCPQEAGGHAVAGRLHHAHALPGGAAAGGVARGARLAAACCRALPAWRLLLLLVAAPAAAALPPSSLLARPPGCCTPAGAGAGQAGLRVRRGGRGAALDLC